MDGLNVERKGEMQGQQEESSIGMDIFLVSG